MTIELIKRMMDTCYLAKRARDMLPPLPDGVMPSYIQYLDAIQKLEAKGLRVKVSDLSDALGLPRPGVTRTVKEMEAKGYLSEAGRQHSKKYDADYFRELAPCLDSISEADAECTIRTIEAFYQVIWERRTSLEKR